MAITIWIDADACPNAIKDILYRVAGSRQLHLKLVANQLLAVPRSPFIKAIKVAKGFDVADNHIVQQCQSDDLVVTADIPLAAQVIAKQAHALNPRGELYTKDNVMEHLAMRNLLSELRDVGQPLRGPDAFSAKDRQAFANALDRFLAGRKQ